MGGYNTTVLDGSGSLEVVSQSLNPYVTTEAESGSSEYSFLVTWFSNNVTYDTDGTYPLLAMENFGTSSFGLYAGDRATYDEAVVIRVGDTEIVTEPDTAGNFVPRQGFHISQFSYNQNTNELLWYVDGYSGSAVVNEDVSSKTVLQSFNSASVPANPSYPTPSLATAWTIENQGTDPFDYVDFTFTVPQTGELQTGRLDTRFYDRIILASDSTPVITSGTGSITTSGDATYTPAADIYTSRTSRLNWTRTAPATGSVFMTSFYNVNTCEWEYNYNNATGSNLEWIASAQKSYLLYNSFDSNISETFLENNDCLEQKQLPGLGDDSTFNLTAIYTASLSWEEMRHNDDFLYPRY